MKPLKSCSSIRATICICASLTVVLGQSISVWSDEVEIKATSSGFLPAEGPTSRWHVGDSWHISISQYSANSMFRPGAKDEIQATYVIEVKVGGEKTVDDMGCWVVSYSVLNPPDKLECKDYKYEAWIDKKDGMLRGLRETSNLSTLSPKIIVLGRARLLAEPVTWFPLSILPLAHADVEYLREKQPQVSISAVLSENKNDFDITMKRGITNHFLRDSPPAHKVVQKWSLNQNWWTEYEERWYGFIRTKGKLLLPSTDAQK